MALSPTSKIENNDSEVFSYEKKVNAGSNVSYPNSDIVSHEHTELVNLFAKLPLSYRSVLEMKILLGYSDKEIATHLGISETAVSTRASRGRTLLREIIRKEGFSI